MRGLLGVRLLDWRLRLRRLRCTSRARRVAYLFGGARELPARLCDVQCS